jgi:hypothetical protein
MSERAEPYGNSEGAYVEKLATFVFRDGRWDVCLYNETFNDGQRYFRVRIRVPDELITGTINAEVSEVKS